MMPPALAVIWIGDRRPVPLPIALFLFWPLAAVAALACAILSAATPPQAGLHRKVAACGLALQFLARSSGVKVDVRSSGSSAIRFRIL